MPLDQAPLVQKSCTPCQGGIPPLSPHACQTLLKELQEGWALTSAHHLLKTYTFKTFKDAMDFATKVADIAEHEAHHPTLTVAWGVCTVEIWTHKIQGLTENDFILAAKIGTLL